ncbi:MAG: RDD family protein, partial [Coleofasciculaceae cyanobacterium SM2_3_26]|nr:RDD family protein [Coleofasciculaceae cyanobacterium SM2_3_26]
MPWVIRPWCIQPHPNAKAVWLPWQTGCGWARRSLRWAIALWQWLLLGKHGQTLPKQWLGVRVVVASGASPGVKGALLREGGGTLGAPLAIAYVFWRISWLFPGSGALLVLGAIALASDGLSARFHPRRRTFHDRLARTYVLDAMPANPRTMPAWNVRTLYPNQRQRVWDRNNEDAAIAAIVLSRSSEEQERQTLWRWMLAHPGTTLVIATASAMAAVLGTYIWSQIYIQGR